MTTSTLSRAPDRRRLSGFTLVEVMIGSVLSAFVLSGVLSSFLFLGRSGVNVANYSDMERQARHGLALFAQDTRQASDLAWVSNHEVRLTVTGATVLFGYDSATQSFYRETSGVRQTLISGVAVFEFKGYMITGAEVDLTDLSTAAARDTASLVTKQLQISLRSQRSAQTVATATNSVLSARYILRNKKVTT